MTQEGWHCILREGYSLAHNGGPEKRIVWEASGGVAAASGSLSSRSYDGAEARLWLLTRKG